MKKLFLLLLITITLIGTNLSAQNMYDRIQAMEIQMNSLQKEIKMLQDTNTQLTQDTVVLKDKDDDEEEEADDNAEEVDEDGEDDNAISDNEDEESDDEDEEDEFEDETSIADLEEEISELNRATGGNHLKFKADYRFAVDNLHYKMANGDTAKNDALLTNRLWIDMGYKATNNLTFKGQLAYNKTFGARSGASTQNTMEGFDWISNENAYDDVLRVRQAYFLWQDRTFLGAQIPWTFSIGRRPSTNGHLINLRDDDHASSPLAHGINVEFDGLSARFTVLPDWGTSIKLCMGRGMTNAKPKFTTTPYASDATDTTDIDLAGLIFVLFDNKQYSFNTMYYYANNLIDANNANPAAVTGFDTVGGMHSGTANITMKGIGDEWSDFTDDTVFFLSAAFSKTDPNKNINSLGNSGMLGSPDSQTGYSYWAGLQIPSLITEDGRWGFEYNYGSKYWRAITYGEDTNIGSKIAVRGNAYEAYFTEYLVDDILSLQIRYTYLDYKYSGSNGFFGNATGTPMKIEDVQAGAAAGNAQMIGAASQIVDTAQDIRFYIRYKY